MSVQPYELADMLTRVLTAYEAELYENNAGIADGLGMTTDVPLRDEAMSLLNRFDKEKPMGKNDLTQQELKAPPDKFVGLYITAKLIHAEMLRDIRKDWPHIYFTARWPLTARLPAEQTKPTRLWTRDNLTDILAAECVLGYADKDDDLRTVNWELAIAWAHGKEIYLVGPREKFGDYAFAERVHRYEELETALKAVSQRIRYQQNHFTQIMDAIEDLRGELMHEPSGPGEADRQTTS